MAFFAGLLGLVLVGQSRIPDHRVEIGAVDLFGQSGLNAGSILGRLSVHSGDRITLGDLSRVRERIKGEVKAVVGKPATDVCLAPSGGGKATLYIGIPGPTVLEVAYLPPPSGRSTLPGEGAALYKSLLARLPAAPAAGVGAEHDSQGFALSADPEIRSIQLRMHAYAVANEAVIGAVLSSSANREQRRAAAMLMGYAQHSPRQIAALLVAASDSDGAVRYGAVRALYTIGHSDRAAQKLIPVDRFVAMLRSGSWSDRALGARIVQTLTDDRDQAVLTVIRKSALPSLLEMARWHDPKSARSALTILGRVAGIEEKRLQKLIAAGDAITIMASLSAE